MRSRRKSYGAWPWLNMNRNGMKLKPPGSSVWTPPLRNTNKPLTRRSQQQAEEIRRLALAEHEQKWNETRSSRLAAAFGFRHSGTRTEIVGAAQEDWRQTKAEYDRRLTEARNQVAENAALRDQVEQSQQEALRARREKERLEELLNHRGAVTANGTATTRAAYEAWEGSAERPNPDWLSFN